MVDQNALKAALADPALSKLSDAEVAATAGFGVPLLTPRTQRITYTAAGAILGAAKAITLRAKLVEAAKSDATAAFVHDILYGGGFDAGNADAQAIGQQFVNAGLLDGDDVAKLLFTASYFAGEAAGEKDVAEARAAMDREAAIFSLRNKVSAAAARFLNESLNPLDSDPAKPVPAWADFQAAVTAEA